MNRVIQVTGTMNLSRNPTEYDIGLNCLFGVVVHRLDDGYNLVKFDIMIQRKIDVGRGHFITLPPEPLQWYIHDDDLIDL